jgi:hypothetical protein
MAIRFAEGARILSRGAAAFVRRVEDNTFRLAAQLYPNLESSL